MGEVPEMDLQEKAGLMGKKQIYSPKIGFTKPKKQASTECNTGQNFMGSGLQDGK